MKRMQPRDERRHIVTLDHTVSQLVPGLDDEICKQIAAGIVSKVRVSETVINAMLTGLNAWISSSGNAASIAHGDWAMRTVATRPSFGTVGHRYWASPFMLPPFFPRWISYIQ
jgi:hypothetical protein